MITNFKKNRIVSIRLKTIPYTSKEISKHTGLDKFKIDNVKNGKSTFDHIELQSIKNFLGDKVRELQEIIKFFD